MSLSVKSYWPLLHLLDQGTECTLISRRKCNDQAQKRKALEDDIEDLEKKKRILVQLSTSLQKDADQLAEEAEGKAGTLIAHLITKSNTRRKRYKEKTNELQQIETELDTKGKELRSIQ
ncbi:hypothetical protein ABG768_026321 [Culter alburnus]|uniref:Uncharacterized protein n=1 Tax=Culter alburnus TaxID=194366 RepID=A0AAW2A9U1_CULAL